MQPKYRASTENRGDSKHYATTRHGSFLMDTEGQGAHPVDTLLASLCACLGHYVRDYLRDHRLAGSGFSITADAGLADDKVRLGDIHVVIDVKGEGLAGDHRSDLLRFVTQCKVYNSLKANSKIQIDLAPEER
jgi:uncharacterized OsmC-like protein